MFILGAANFCQQPLRSTVALTSPSISAVLIHRKNSRNTGSFKRPPLESPVTNALPSYYIAPRCLSNAILKSSPDWSSPHILDSSSQTGHKLLSACNRLSTAFERRTIQGSTHRALTTYKRISLKNRNVEFHTTTVGARA
jgi:hypothetical protein